MLGKKAFTLIELLVVISIIALLLSILMPSLGLIKRKAQGAVCQSNMKQMALAWFLYAGDNNDSMVGGDTNEPNPTLKQYSWRYSWVNPPQDDDRTLVPAGEFPTFEQEARGIERGRLFPYVGQVKLYNCVGAKDDKFQGGYRSYSITALMNGEYAKPESWGGYPEHAVAKTVEIKRPGEKIVFLENTDFYTGWNQGSWVMDIWGITWGDPLAIWHGDSSTMGFADGHAELHKWRCESTKILSEEQIWALNPNDYDGDRTDLEYMYEAFFPRGK